MWNRYPAVLIAALISVLAVLDAAGGPEETYPIVDTGQQRCYDSRREIVYPAPGGRFAGQDAQYQGHAPAYRDNGDGTISDLVTGLMWQKSAGEKKTHAQALAGVRACRLGGHKDWRLPTIKELYSLINFSGEDIDPEARDTSKLKPFIDTRYFGFRYGEASRGERAIDSQFATSTIYRGTTMRGNKTMFGVNFADGRIKGYPLERGRRGVPTYFVLYVRGRPGYGKNKFHDNGDGTVTDRATGLTWMKRDSGHLKAGPKRDGGLNWEQALSWAEALEHAGHSDWRLPNAKELQSILDYQRSPSATRSAAIDAVFSVTTIRDGRGEVNYPSYWSSTTHKRKGGGEAAVYLAFGKAQGWMKGRGSEPTLLDVHGAGSQRSDPKAGDPSRYPHGRGPQGDVITIYNMVRAVRGGKAAPRARGPKILEQTARERPPEGGRSAGDRFVKRNDRNGDGKVSRDEFRGPDRAFNRLDRNRDGFLTADEAPHRKGQGPGSQGGDSRKGGGSRKGGDSGGAPPGGGGEQKQGAVTPTGKAAVTRAQADKAAASTGVRANAEWLKQPPSFVFVLVDDMGWTGMSVASDRRVPQSKSDFYKTPSLEALARKGMCFSNAYAPSPMCAPTRASILTGKSPAQLHMTTPGQWKPAAAYHKMAQPRHVSGLPTSLTTIAELLATNKYATAHFGKWHLSGGGPGQHGFESHDGGTGNGGPGAYTDPNPKDIFGITLRAMRYMERQVEAGKPFYVQLSHYALHSPTQALKETQRDLAGIPAGRRHTNVEYAAMTRNFDTAVGMLMKKIAALGIGPNTYVIFMSDNGPGGRAGQLSNAPLRGGKATLYEGGIRVPMIVAGPGVAPASTCNESVIGYDLLPTLCELAGVSTTGVSGLEGRSIVALLKPGADREAFVRPHDELVFHFPHYAKGPKQKPQSAIRVGRYKLIRHYDNGTEQLFDLSADIGEARDLAQAQPDRRADLARRLDAYLARVKAQLPTPNKDYDPTQKPTRGRRKQAR